MDLIVQQFFNLTIMERALPLVLAGLRQTIIICLIVILLQVEKRIGARVKRQMDKTQREYFLNAQMKAIQKEIGDEDGKNEFAETEAKIKKTKFSKEAREKATHELKKLRHMSPMSRSFPASAHPSGVLISRSRRARGPRIDPCLRANSACRNTQTSIAWSDGPAPKATHVHWEDAHEGPNQAIS